MLLLKKSLYFLAFLALVVTLGEMTSTSEFNNSFAYKYESSVIETNNQVISVAAFVNINQAAKFNHLNQITISYIFVAILVLFLVCAVNYQWHKPITPPPPWYLTLIHCSRINHSGWKISNLQFKAQLTYPY